MTEKELLVYIDPGFLDNIGHYRNFAVNIHKEAYKRGVDIWHFVNNEVSEVAADKYSLEKKFKYKAVLRGDLDSNSGANLKILDSLESSFSAIKGRIYNYLAISSFSRSMKEILDRVQNTDYDKVSIYMYTSHPLYFSVFAKLLSQGEYSHLNITVHLGLFYLNLKFCNGESATEYEGMLRKVSESLEQYDPRQGVKLYADSERSIQRYSPYFKRPLKLYPIPLGLRSNNTRDNKPRNKDSRTITIGFFGYTHEKQGYHLIKGLYEQMVESDGFPYIHFIVRHNILGLTSEMEKAVGRFKKQTKQITHLIGDLPKDKYEEHLAGCDLILIPHSRLEYPCQTSGLFIDALKKQKVVVIPKDTWMEDQLKVYGSGRSFESGDIESFTSAVRDVIINFDDYSTKTSRNIEAFVDFHTVESLFDTLEIGMS